MITLHRRHLEAYRSDLGRYFIEIKLRDIRELFNKLDPVPFRKKDLDPAAEEYLVSAVREIGSHPSMLLLHIPEGTTRDDADGLISAIRHYFTYRAWHTGEQLRLLLWRGLISLIIGMLFLIACLWLRQLLDAFTGVAGKSIASEGLLILGWVAMWRPVEIFLYDWWPELGRRLLFLRIAGMSIEVRTGSEEVDLRHALRDARTSDTPSMAGPVNAAAAHKQITSDSNAAPDYALSRDVSPEPLMSAQRRQAEHLAMGAMHEETADEPASRMRRHAAREAIDRAE